VEAVIYWLKLQNKLREVDATSPEVFKRLAQASKQAQGS